MEETCYELQATPESEELCAEIAHLNLGIVVNAMKIEVTPTLEKEILNGQLEDEKLKEIAQNVVQGKAPRIRIDDNGTLWLGKGCVPEVKAIRDIVDGP